MTFHPVFPVPLIVAMAGLSMLAAVWLAIRGRQPSPRWIHAPVLLLRFAAIAALAVLLLNPARRVVSEVPESRSLILVDRSASMRLGPRDGPARLDEALAWTESALAAVSAAGLPEPEVLTFAEDTSPFPESPQADGAATLLATSLERAAVRGGAEAADQLIVVSDGLLHDRDRLARALAAVDAAGASVSTHLVGTDTPPRNAWITSVQAPRIVRPRSTATVHAAVDFTGVESGETRCP